MFMNENCVPQWMFLSIADRDAPSATSIDVSKLDSEIFLTSQGFDTTAFPLSSGEESTGSGKASPLLPPPPTVDDMWMYRDLGPGLIQIDDSIFDMPL